MNIFFKYLWKNKSLCNKLKANYDRDCAVSRTSMTFCLLFPLRALTIVFWWSYIYIFNHQREIIVAPWKKRERKKGEQKKQKKLTEHFSWNVESLIKPKNIDHYPQTPEPVLLGRSQSQSSSDRSWYLESYSWIKTEFRCRNSSPATNKGLLCGSKYDND